MTLSINYEKISLAVICIMYADDLLPLSVSISGLQQNVKYFTYLPRWMILFLLVKICLF